MSSTVRCNRCSYPWSAHSIANLMQPLPTIGTPAPGKLEQVLAFLLLATCAGLLAFKFYVAWRININWDEFWFLSFVHSLLRNELTMVMQGGYTHLFTWLPFVGANEADQIVATRLVMLCLLGLTAFMIWRLGSRWFGGLAGAVPPFVYLSAIPVMTHGGSFRADSILAPLLMCATALLASSKQSTRDEWLAGAAIGVAAAVTVKVLLFAPMFLLLIVATRATQGNQAGFLLAALFRSAMRIGVAALVVAVLLIGAHAASVTSAVSAVPGAVPTESIAVFASRTASTTLLDAKMFAQGRMLAIYANWQPLFWLLIGVGALVSAFRRRFDVLALGLALLPIAFYRNAYPYFYVVMLAPASLLAGLTIATVRDFVASKGPQFALSILLTALWLGLMHQGLLPIPRLLQDNLSHQRSIIAATHQIFPDPVNYIDRCGMISSYRKVNFFMSTWGIAAYRAANVPVMANIAERARPAFLIMNVRSLNTSEPNSQGLLEPDRLFVQRTYSR
jgi:hypothetical protein